MLNQLREISIIVSDTKIVFEFLSQLVYKKIGYHPPLLTETYMLSTPWGYEITRYPPLP